MTDQLLYVAAAGFESACQVSCLASGHRASRLHGHSFWSEVRASLPVGWAPFPGAEVDALRESLQACIAPLDYRHLNDLIDMPTDENVARWIRQNITVPGIQTVGIQSTIHSGVDLDPLQHAPGGVDPAREHYLACDQRRGASHAFRGPDFL